MNRTPLQFKVGDLVTTRNRIEVVSILEAENNKWVADQTDIPYRIYTSCSIHRSWYKPSELLPALLTGDTVSWNIDPKFIGVVESAFVLDNMVYYVIKFSGTNTRHLRAQDVTKIMTTTFKVDDQVCFKTDKERIRYGIITHIGDVIHIDCYDDTLPKTATVVSTITSEMELLDDYYFPVGTKVRNTDNNLVGVVTDIDMSAGDSGICYRIKFESDGAGYWRQNARSNIMLYKGAEEAEKAEEAEEVEEVINHLPIGTRVLHHNSESVVIDVDSDDPVFPYQIEYKHSGRTAWVKACNVKEIYGFPTPTPTPTPTKGNTMSQFKIVTTLTVDDYDIETVGFDTLNTLVERATDRVKAMSDRNVKTKAYKKQIAEAQAELDALVAFVDARFEKENPEG